MDTKQLIEHMSNFYYKEKKERERAKNINAQIS